MLFNFQQVESVFEKPDEKPEEEQSTFASKLFTSCLSENYGRLSISPTSRNSSLSQNATFFHQKSEAKFQASLEAQKKTKIKKAK